jgi:SAM-dependent methyltransferase
MSAYELSALVRHYSRLVAFSLPPVRRLLEHPTSAPSDLAPQLTDLKDTTTTDQTAATVANLIRYRLPEYPRVLDVGCAGGTLAGELPPTVHYLGIDASECDIATARSLWGSHDILFAAHDIREYEPAGEWDAIVFSEVLSDLAVHRAIAEIRRYAKALSPEGMIVVSMMNEGKGRAIWRALRQEFRWIDGILWQQKEPWPSYRISVSRERPGYLVAVLGSRQTSEVHPVERKLALERRVEQEGAQHEQLRGATIRTGPISRRGRRP